MPRNQNDDEMARQALAFAKMIGPLPRIDTRVLATAEIAAQAAKLAQLYDRNIISAYSQMADFASNQAVFAEQMGRQARQWETVVNQINTVAAMVAANQAATLRQVVLSFSATVIQAQQQIAALAALPNAFADTLSHIVLPWMPDLGRLRELLRARLLSAFRRMQLWPSPSMSEDLISSLANHAESGNLRAVVATVLGYYRRDKYANLELAISQWWDDTEFAARRHIIEDALKDHCERRYTLTVPTLLIQAEGIARDFVRGNVYAPLPAKGSSKAPHVVARSVEAARIAVQQMPNGLDIVDMVLVDAVLDYVQTVAFSNTDFGTQYEELRNRRRMNRHGIAHGIQINYHSAMNSLRAFLLLDALYGLRQLSRLALQPASANP